MKKIIALMLTMMMLVSLVACGENKANNKDSSKTQQTSSNDSGKSQNTDQSTKKDDNKNQDQSTKKDDNKEDTSLVSGNFHMVATGLNLYKIGNDFMNSESDFWRYVGEGLYEIYYWDNGGFVDSGCTCRMESFLEFTADYLKKATKTTETKEICGVTCVKYTDMSETEYYLDEESNLIFEIWFKGATRAAYVVTKWETNVTEFPVSAPQK